MLYDGGTIDKTIIFFLMQKIKKYIPSEHFKKMLKELHLIQCLEKDELKKYLTFK